MNKDMRILIVDDHCSMRRILRGFLEELGYRDIQEAEDGAQAMTMLKMVPAYDFVITDRNMPNMNGIELLKAIRADAALKNLPVLLVTAEQKRDQIMEAIQAKVSGYIVKPFNSSILQDKLDKIFVHMNSQVQWMSQALQGSQRVGAP